MNRSPSVRPQVIRDIEADALKPQARLDPPVIRDVQAEALEQAHLAQDHPTQGEGHGLRRWLHGA